MYRRAVESVGQFSPRATSRGGRHQIHHVPPAADGSRRPARSRPPASARSSATARRRCTGSPSTCGTACWRRSPSRGRRRKTCARRRRAPTGPGSCKRWARPSRGDVGPVVAAVLVPLGARAVVTQEHDQRVVPLAGVFQGLETPGRGPGPCGRSSPRASRTTPIENPCGPGPDGPSRRRRRSGSSARSSGR